MAYAFLNGGGSGGGGSLLLLIKVRKSLISRNPSLLRASAVYRQVFSFLNSMPATGFIPCLLHALTKSRIPMVLLISVRASAGIPYRTASSTIFSTGIVPYRRL